MNEKKLIEITSRLMETPKGILAIDESLPTCNKRFEKLGVPTTKEKRREYRELLITAPDIEKYISGYILFDETIRQSTKSGKNFTSILEAKGIDIGIKVDQGLDDFPNHPLEKITKGIEELPNKLKEYKNFGATFAKWRAVYTVGGNIPSDDCLRENSLLLAKYALACQELNMVPIIEPEILYEGEHTIEQCYEASARNYDALFSELRELNVFLPGVVLKTSMVLAGKEAKVKSSTEEIAKMTLKCLEEHVPAHIGGIAFLSGGQNAEEATVNLNAMHQRGSLPWPLSFSYARAIQNGALEAWAKNPEDVVPAQALLLIAAKNNSEASLGKYKR